MRFEDRADLLKPGYLPFESGILRHEDGSATLAALTRMPRCRARMVDWWFGWLGDSEDYKLWHPRDHVFSGWENKQGSTYIGASHLVHEYLAGRDGPLYKLRIPIVHPHEFFDAEVYDATGNVAICSHPGLLEQPVQLGHACHMVRDTDFGCEMRTRFWLGHIDSTDPAITLSETQKAEMRAHGVTDDFCRRLHQHAIEEMGYLADLLPILYRQSTGDAQF